MKRYFLLLSVIALFALQACGSSDPAVEEDGSGYLVPPVSSGEGAISLEGAAGLESPAQGAPSGCAASDANAAQFATEVLALVNQERAANGLGAVTLNAQLTQAAQGHSFDMGCNFFLSHTGSDGSDPGARIDATGYYWLTWGENVAAGYSTPAAAMNGWMNSPGHRANILDGSFTEMGIGYAYNSGDTVNKYYHYWTMVLADQ